MELEEKGFKFPKPEVTMALTMMSHRCVVSQLMLDPQWISTCLILPVAAAT